jgi:hypothetical protein
VVVDTAQDAFNAVVHAASIQDWDCARLLLRRRWEKTRDTIQEI